MATPRWRRHVAYLPRGDGRGIATPRWQHRGGDATWRWERDGNAEVAMGSGSGAGSEGGHGRGIGIRKRRWRWVPHFARAKHRTWCTCHVAHFPHRHVAYLPHHLVPRGNYGGGDAEVATGAGWRRRDGDAMLASSSSPTGKCEGGDAEVATGAASTPRGKCGLTI
ncbi:hypothetical protein CBR_g36630 [Chara braunii]|uniref:Uncharacterized protein n=1 Tax=Chara braunii TaxID=69332 RepID=A0A388LL83_CHABU|nr:hypothetical protein CBR_g36630 [Chara braunii]|eukprot:GBG83011.1 hypothetical protein CBR_g36630 [Chara braunii]